MTNKQHAQDESPFPRPWTAETVEQLAAYAAGAPDQSPMLRDLIDAARAYAAALRAPQGETWQPIATCAWVEIDEAGIWQGDCGACWTFISDGPIENKMRFCPNCGKRIPLPPVSPVSEQE